MLSCPPGSWSRSRRDHSKTGGCRDGSGLTAHYLSHSTYPLGPGKTALILAAAGGTGRLLVQIAKKLGAFVIATASSDEKIQLARSAGADEVIPYTRVDFESETKRLTNGKGVDAVYDSVGRDTFSKSLNCLHPVGRWCSSANPAARFPGGSPDPQLQGLTIPDSSDFGPLYGRSP